MILRASIEIVARPYHSNNNLCVKKNLLGVPKKPEKDITKLSFRKIDF